MDSGELMKKSEMVKIMINKFYEANKEILDDPEQRLNTLDVAVSMPDVLDKMVEAGMMPPFAYLQKLGMLATAWEPEDGKDED